MLTKLINNDLKKVNGGIYFILDKTGNRIYKAVGDNGDYQTLTEAATIEWKHNCREYKGKIYPGLGVPITDVNSFIIVNERMFNRRKEAWNRREIVKLANGWIV